MPPTGRVARIILALVIAGAYRAASFAQAGDAFILRSTIDGGGATSAAVIYRVAGTIGQPNADSASGGSYLLNGGFWAGIVAVATPTATLTITVSPTHTPTTMPSPTNSATAAPSPTTPAPSFTPTIAPNTPTNSATASRVPSATITAPPSSHTVTPTPSSSPTSPPMLTADLNCDERISAADVSGFVLLVGSGETGPCNAAFNGDINGDGVVDQLDVDALIEAMFAGRAATIHSAL